MWNIEEIVLCIKFIMGSLKTCIPENEFSSSELAAREVMNILVHNGGS
jgi:hypothetical protein